MPMELKKQLGQHFLKDAGTLDRMVRLIRPAAEDVVVEVGAGEGALSARLAPLAGRLLAVEVDSDCLEGLQGALAPYPNARVVHGDILATELPALVGGILEPGCRLRIVGNLPYNLATAIVSRMLDLTLPIRDMVFLVQLEVAQRITASPGSRQYGYFSVRCQYLCAAKMGMRVPPSCFVPRPQVTSAAVILKMKDAPRSPELEESIWEVARAAFAYRRKTLANSFRHHRRIAPVADALLQRAGISGALRAERLSVEDFARLGRLYHEMVTGYPVPVFPVS
jgi:16S rRNA (adenine1518-N6/adenine1519-N6)-dimethyltransferase